MFELTNEECNSVENSSRSQNATSKRGGNSSYYPHTKKLPAQGESLCQQLHE